MKKTLLSILLLYGITVAGFAQTLSGEYNNDGKSTGSYYTKIKWEVSYRFEEKNGSFYIKFYNPKISVPNYSLYHDEFKKEYSLAELGLAKWPNTRQLPFAMSVKANVSDGYNNYEVTASCNADFTCGDTYIVSKANVKNVTLQNFRVTGVTNFRANLGGEPAVDDILKNKRQSAGRPSGTNNVPANTASANGTISTASPVNTSGNDPLANYNSTYRGNTKTEIYVQAATTALGSLVDQMNANYDKKMARLKTESDERLLTSVMRQQARFESYYFPLIDLANKGNEDAQIILYLESDNFLKEKVPLREEWLKKAVENKNTVALLTNVNNTGYKKSYPPSDYQKVLRELADSGNVDAMVMLGLWYSQSKKKSSYFYRGSIYGTQHSYMSGGENAELAIKYLSMAAEKKSPNAMYFLGMIYKYGQIKLRVREYGFYMMKFDIKKDEKLAFEWFSKSLIPDYKESLYLSHHLTRAFWEGSTFDAASYKELAMMYKQGKVVNKDLSKAAELERLYTDKKQLEYKSDGCYNSH